MCESSVDLSYEGLLLLSLLSCGRSRLLLLSRGGGVSLGCSGLCCRTWREIELVDCMRGACGCALAAHLALHVVDIGYIVLDLDGVESTLLHTLATADAGVFASLHCHSALVLVDTRDKKPTILGSLVAELDDALGASLGACAASDTLVVIYLWQTSLLVHLDGSELACVYAITATETAIGAISLTRKIGSQNGALLSAVILKLMRTCHAIAITTDYSHFGGCCNDLLAQDSGYFSHSGSATDRAKHRAYVIGLDEGVGHAVASGETTAAAVGAREGSLNLADTGVFIDLELLRHEIENHSRNAARDCQCRNSYENK